LTDFFGLQLFQALELIAGHTAMFFTTSIMALNRCTDLPHSFRRRPSLPLQHFNLSQLQHNVLGLLSLASHLVVLLKTG
jgi:hypothetical protein